MSSVWIYFLFFLSFIYLTECQQLKSSSSSKTHQAKDGKSVTGDLRVTSRCVGDVIDLRCPIGHRIKVVSDWFGRSEEQGECSFKKGHCRLQNRREMSLIHRYCEGQRACSNFLVESRYCENDENGELRKKTNKSFTNYEQVEYYCIPDKDIMNMCSSIHLSASSGYLASPRFPHEYPPGRHCTCVLRSSHPVRLDFHHFMVRYDQPCKDWVEISTRASDTRASDTRASDTRASDTRAPDISASDTRAPDTRAYDTRASDIRAYDTRASDTRASDTRASDTPASDTRAPDTRASDTRAPDTRASDTRASDTRASDTRASDTRASDTRASDTRAPDIRAYDTRASDNRASDSEPKYSAYRLRVEEQRQDEKDLEKELEHPKSSDKYKNEDEDEEIILSNVSTLDDNEGHYDNDDVDNYYYNNFHNKQNKKNPHGTADLDHDYLNFKQLLSSTFPSDADENHDTDREVYMKDINESSNEFPSPTKLRSGKHLSKELSKPVHKQKMEENKYSNSTGYGTSPKLVNNESSLMHKHKRKLEENLKSSILKNSDSFRHSDNSKEREKRAYKDHRNIRTDRLNESNKKRRSRTRLCGSHTLSVADQEIRITFHSDIKSSGHQGIWFQFSATSKSEEEKVDVICETKKELGTTNDTNRSRIHLSNNSLNILANNTKESILEAKKKLYVRPVDQPGLDRDTTPVTIVSKNRPESLNGTEDSEVTTTEYNGVNKAIKNYFSDETNASAYSKDSLTYRLLEVVVVSICVGGVLALLVVFVAVLLSNRRNTKERNSRLNALASERLQSQLHCLSFYDSIPVYDRTRERKTSSRPARPSASETLDDSCGHIRPSITETLDDSRGPTRPSISETLDDSRGPTRPSASGTLDDSRAADSIKHQTVTKASSLISPVYDLPETCENCGSTYKNDHTVSNEQIYYAGKNVKVDTLDRACGRKESKTIRNELKRNSNTKDIEIRTQSQFNPGYNEVSLPGVSHRSTFMNRLLGSRTAEWIASTSLMTDMNYKVNSTTSEDPKESNSQSTGTDPHDKNIENVDVESAPASPKPYKYFHSVTCPTSSFSSSDNSDCVHSYKLSQLTRGLSYSHVTKKNHAAELQYAKFPSNKNNIQEKFPSNNSYDKMSYDPLFEFERSSSLNNVLDLSATPDLQSSVHGSNLSSDKIITQEDDESDVNVESINDKQSKKLSEDSQTNANYYSTIKGLCLKRKRNSNRECTSTMTLPSNSIQFTDYVNNDKYYEGTLSISDYERNEDDEMSTRI